MVEVVEIIGIIAIQVFEFTDSDNGETFLWNATEGRRRAIDKKAEVVPVSLSDIGMTPATILRFAPDLDTRKALYLPGAALLSPLLFVEHKNKHVLIDGWHRLYKAAVSGVPVLPAYVLSQSEADAIRVVE